MNAAGDSTRHNRECCFQQNVTGSLNTNAHRPPWVQQSFHLTHQQALRSESRAHTELIAADKHRTLIPRGHLSMFKVYNYVWKHDRLDLDQSSFTSLRIIREEEQEITNHIDRRIGGVCQARWENTKNSDTFFFFCRWIHVQEMLWRHIAVLWSWHTQKVCSSFLMFRFGPDAGNFMSKSCWIHVVWSWR